MRKLQKKQAQASLKSSKHIMEQLLPPVDSIAHIQNMNASTEYYQSFVYTDHITNNILNLDIQNSSDDNASSNITCASALIRSTKKFHISSLKHKNYRLNKIKQHQGASARLDNNEYVKQKLIQYSKRKQQQRSQYSYDKKQLSRMLSRDKSYLFSSANTSLQLSPLKQKKQNISKTVDLSLISKKLKQNQISINFDHDQENIEPNKCSIKSQAQIFNQFEACLAQQKQKRAKLEAQGKIYIKSSNNDPHQNEPLTQLESQIMEKINRELRSQIMKNAQYLITPNQSKLKLFSKPKPEKSKLNKNEQQSKTIKDDVFLTRKERAKNILKIQQQVKTIEKIESSFSPKKQKSNIREEISKYKFSLDNVEQLMKNCMIQSVKSSRKVAEFSQVIDHVPIVLLIKQGNFFKIEIQLSLNPALLQTKQNSNNLLHICVLNDQPEIFLFVLEKSLENHVQLHLEVNKYGKTPIQTMKVYRYFYNKVEKFQKFHHLMKSIK